MWDTPPHQQFNRSFDNERLFSFGGVNMSKLYIFLILEMFLYKSISKFLFTMECQSLPQEDVSQELKQWKFSFDQILYYLIIVVAILKPLVAIVFISKLRSLTFADITFKIVTITL